MSDFIPYLPSPSSHPLFLGKQSAKQLAASRIARSLQDLRKALPGDTLEIFQPGFFNPIEILRFGFQLALRKLIVPFDHHRIAPEFVARFDFYPDSICH